MNSTDLYIAGNLLVFTPLYKIVHSAKAYIYNYMKWQYILEDFARKVSRLKFKLNHCEKRFCGQVVLVMVQMRTSLLLGALMFIGPQPAQTYNKSGAPVHVCYVNGKVYGFVWSETHF